MKVVTAGQMADLEQASERAGVSTDTLMENAGLAGAVGVVPLAALFDGGRKLFEKGKAIREAQKARMVEKARRQGEEKERERIKKALEKHGVSLDPAVVEDAFGDRSEDNA